MEQAPVLVAEKIYKSFDYPIHFEVLNGVDFSLKPGDSVAIIGPSGQGKSTFLQLLGALDSPTQGTVKLLGKTVTPYNSAYLRRHHIGYMFQAFYLLEDYTVLENALMPARIARQNTQPGSEAYKRLDSLLDNLGLGHRKSFNTKLLSGGEKQRLALARALCNNPSILLADEPTGNLDHDTAHDIFQLMEDWVNNNQTSLVIATHDLEIAHRCERIYQLKNGKLHSIKE
ncbi:MAG: lolD [Chlamydiales bacterium]|jgi:lipoprotein-releasing system ATP-binding protein|nr:lolD [Chlamydiales bacterium]